MGGSSVGVSASAESAAVAAVARLVVLAGRMGATLTVWGDSVGFDGGDLVVRAGGCLLTSMTAMSLLPSVMTALVAVPF